MPGMLPVNNFSFQTTPRIVFEAGGVKRLGPLMKELGISRPFIVSDDGLVKAGIVGATLESVPTSGCAPASFTDVLADPPEQCVLRAVELAREHRADGVIGLGGGSSMDTGKLVALLACTQQSLDSIYGIGLAKGPRLPLVQIPTTAGTGSEVTPIAIVTTPTQEKKGVVSPLLYADVALLDAELTTGLSPATTAMTGVDAMVHAIEAYTTRRLKNPISDALAVEALSLLYNNIHRAVNDGANLPARQSMLLGSMLAGMAFANAPVAAVHALAYPIGGHYHVSHGLSNALVLTPVLRFNAPEAQSLYARLAEVISPGRRWNSPQHACDAFIDAIATLVASMPFAQRLRDVGVTQDRIPMLADDAMRVTRLLINNPREVSRDDVIAIYQEAWGTNESDPH